MNPLTRLDAQQLRQRLDAGAITARAVVRACLDRIEALDARLHAFLRVNPRAEEEAQAADALIRDGRAGPLTGIPVAVKDNLATAGLRTSCASAMLDRFVPARDATAVARLRRAGAVVLGKTNLDEFGMGSSTESSAYWPTRNPWDDSRVPGGSSGGSAVALAAGMAPLALGSDTGGSVRQPAALCGVVGLKPTYGRVSRSGLVAFGSSLDQVGPMARTVADAARLLEGIAGHDPDDMTSSPCPVGNYVDACRRGVEGLRIGLPREYLDRGLDAEVGAAVKAAARELQRQGASVEDVTLPHSRYAIPTYYLVATAEASSNLARYDAVRYGLRVDRGGGLRGMYRASRGEGFGAEVKRRIMLGTYALSAGYFEAFYGRAQRARTLVRKDFVDLFSGGIDLILCPTTPTAAFRLGEKLDDPLQMYLSDVYTVTASLAGLPALSLPLARSGAGLPIGGQLIGPDFGEESLCRAGATLERYFRLDPPPIADHDEGGAEGP